jgi:hypothetical protein
MFWMNYSAQIKENISGMTVGEVREANFMPKTKYEYQCSLPAVVRNHFKGMVFKTKSDKCGALWIKRIS